MENKKSFLEEYGIMEDEIRLQKEFLKTLSKEKIEEISSSRKDSKIDCDLKEKMLNNFIVQTANDLSEIEYYYLLKTNCDYLYYIKNQTLFLCLEAIKINSFALRYVNVDLFSKKDYEDICEYAFKSGGGMCLQFVNAKNISKEKYMEFSIIASLNDWRSFQFLQFEDLTIEEYEEVFFKYLEQKRKTNNKLPILKYAKRQTLKMCLEVLKGKNHEYGNIQYVNESEFTEKEYFDICIAALKNAHQSIDLIKNLTKEMVMFALREYPFEGDSILFTINYQNKLELTEDMYILASEMRGGFIDLIPENKKTESICLAALKNDKKSIAYVNFKELGF
jgi:hypothetical protein